MTNDLMSQALKPNATLSSLKSIIERAEGDSFLLETVAAHTNVDEETFALLLKSGNPLVVSAVKRNPVFPVDFIYDDFKRLLANTRDESILAKYCNTKDGDQMLLILKNPAATIKVLTRLLHPNQYVEVVQAIVAHPAATSSLLRKVIRYFPDHWDILMDISELPLLSLNIARALIACAKQAIENVYDPEFDTLISNLLKCAELNPAMLNSLMALPMYDFDVILFQILDHTLSNEVNKEFALKLVSLKMATSASDLIEEDNEHERAAGLSEIIEYLSLYQKIISNY